MKKMILLFAVLVLSCLPPDAGATAIPFTFEGSAAGGAASAKMEISITGNVLEATIYNTSPIKLDDGTVGNYPGITGFGFNLDPDELQLEDWELRARNAENNALFMVGSWDMVTKLTNIRLDYIPTTGGNNDGRLYNPEAYPLSYGVNSVYYTAAVLTMTFDETPMLNTTAEFSPFVRMQNVGVNGEGGVKMSATPEPATLLLLGAGLAGLLGVGRRLGRNRRG